MQTSPLSNLSSVATDTEQGIPRSISETYTAEGFGKRSILWTLLALLRTMTKRRLCFAMSAAIIDFSCHR